MASVVKIYTDGACSGNPGPGGWAWATDDGRQDAGYESNTTNQRMELMAPLMALRQVEQTVIRIVSDSAYVVNCFHQRWYERWRVNGWRGAGGKSPVANRDLWEPLIAIALDKYVIFEKVKGHSGDPMNDYVDRLAVAARDSHLVEIRCAVCSKALEYNQCSHEGKPEAEPHHVECCESIGAELGTLF